MRILSGIQPSGTLHLGNYFGMMRPALELQEKGEAFYFIANYHSMTTLVDPAERRQNTLDVALDFLACGLDPKKTVFFRQSDVPEVTELTWILGTVTPMGLLERCHSYKDKVAKGISAQPRPLRLSRADGRGHPDLRLERRAGRPGPEAARRGHARHRHQVQRAIRRDVRRCPNPQIRAETAKVPGLDGQKMSKSYGNTIEIFGEEKALRKKIMGIKMDSRTPQEPKPDADQNLAIQILKLVAPPEVAKDYEERLRAGGLGYGDLKKALFEHYWNHFAAARAKRAELAANLDYVNQVLTDGATKARTVAQKVLQRAKVASGLE